MTRAGGHRAGRGFTLVELIVVGVLMVVLAGLIVPRVAGMRERAARAEVERVRNLLTGAAQRQALTVQPLALGFDAEAAGGDSTGGRLSVLVPATGERARRAWAPDALIAPVSLGEVALESCTVSGVSLNPRRWIVPLTEGEVRPSVRLVLASRDGARWAVVLPEGAISAFVEDQGGAGESRAVDLDASGWRDQPW